ncbi:isochorismatase family protein [Amycolatopsis rubida]|uniref:Isochorismatase family protein n=1 Tax=Amycolatopsis rubida TaxID=112413 RepID=A0ABX0BU10_9PSEU|nr:isochorismatase family protein [Amycolatopsis rubida]NEC56305.1 isochorismatase family protein [Amycolatopsis rubida]
MVHIRNNSIGDDPDVPGTSGWELVHEARPGEHVVDKQTPDSFAGTQLGSVLPESARWSWPECRVTSASEPPPWPPSSAVIRARWSTTPTPRTTTNSPPPRRAPVWPGNCPRLA